MDLWEYYVPTMLLNTSGSQNYCYSEFPIAQILQITFLETRVALATWQLRQ